MKTVKKILKGLGIILLTIVLVFAGFLGYMTMKDYRPAPLENVELICAGTDSIKTGAYAISLEDTLSFYTWNIGYGGLGAEQDFFFDGGKMVRPSKELNQKYMNEIMANIQSMDSVDFMLFQEVDKSSKRSYFQDQVKAIIEACPRYCSGYATNYKSQFVPQPVSNPYGRCFGGILTLSRINYPAKASRFALAPDASWPTGLFMLKRCYMEFRYPLSNGKELVVINQHLSAYDDGTVKQRQLDTLKMKLLSEYEKGNYVIVGGDWNTYPPGYTSNLREKGKDGIVEKSMDANYPAAGWKYVYDGSIGSNRKLYEPYIKGKTDEVVIDYFLLSPNVYSISVQTVDLGFENSDHQPVYMKVTFNPPLIRPLKEKAQELR